MKWFKRFFIVLIMLLMLGLLANLFSRIPVGDRIAILRIDGIILNAEPIVRKLEALRKDKSVKALVIRAESPGGSVGASQEIYRALERFKETGKPVVVSMGNVCASGCFYISMVGDYIYANPGTITGSIGVIVQHTSLKDLLSKLGIKTTSIKTGKFKDTLSPTKELTEEEIAYLQALINKAYEQFIQAILKYRKEIDPSKLREVADGRVFNGEDAYNLRLVDGIGGLQDAIDKAQALAKIEKPRIFYIEESKSLLRRLFENRLSLEFESQSPLMIYYILQ
jgi:signal peptide peptidase A. Serine peptidase. MEROPS family S49